MAEGVANMKYADTEGYDAGKSETRHMALPAHLEDSQSQSAECLYGGAETAGQDCDDKSPSMGLGYEIASQQVDSENGEEIIVHTV